VIPHLWHVIQGARYERQGGRHFDAHAYTEIKTIAEHRHYAGDIRDHAWWGREPEPPADTLAAGGGHAHCGAMVYLGDNWPAGFRNQIFMNNVHGNRVNNDLLERRGSGYVGKRAPDLLLANDKWFRGINLKYGPDGSVYLIDWYDRNACHRTNPEIWDRTNGRVYRISYGQPKSVVVDLGRANDDQLIQLQLHPNDWYVRMARRLLQERAAREPISPRASEALWKLATQHQDAARRLRAVWTLHVCGALTDERRAELLSSDDENLRSWAIQLEMEDGHVDSAVIQRLATMARDDPSQLVRLYLCSALQRLPLDDRWTIAANLVAHADDASDPNLPSMIWYAVEPLVPADPQRALDLAAASQIDSVRAFILRRAAADDRGVDLVARMLVKAQSTPEQTMILDQMLLACSGRVGMRMPAAWNEAYAAVERTGDAALQERAEQLAVLFGDQRVLPRLRERLVDSATDMSRREQALQILVRAQDKQAAPALQAVLDEPALRGHAIRALANLDHAGTPEAILARYKQLSDAEKRDAIGSLTARPAFAMALLQAIADGRVPNVDLHAYNVRQLLNFHDASLNERLKQVWGEIREASADKKDQIERIKQICTADSEAPTNPGNGRRIFIASCANCHRLFGSGGEVGPDITGSNRANLDYILENVVDPSAVLGKDYRMTVLELSDGRVVSGLIQQETDSAITVRTLNDTLLVAKSDVESRTLSELSMMPEGLLDRLPSQEIRDLIAYLASPTQVTLRGPSPTIDPTTSRVEGALEAESLKLVEKTDGGATGQRMEAFRDDRWSGNEQLWWTGAGPGDKLAVALPVAQDGTYRLQSVLTLAPDYAIVQIRLDDQPLGEPLDLYEPRVVTTGLLDFGSHHLSAGEHRLSFEIIGANPRAIKSHMVGVDFVQLTPAGQ
jgi:putative heme-binding domain-containing protein